MDTINFYLLMAGIINAIAAFAHIGCIIFGASWYRFFGAGEQMAQWAEQGLIKPTIITSGIALMLFVWSAFAFSGAHVLSAFPLLRMALITITSIYLLRAITGIPLALLDKERSTSFWFWSSLICAGIGLLHLIGILQSWESL